MNNHTAHITIDGKPLCQCHEHLLGMLAGDYAFNDPDGNCMTCDYTDTRKARAVYKYLKDRMTNANVRLRGGPCPIMMTMREGLTQ